MLPDAEELARRDDEADALSSVERLRREKTQHEVGLYTNEELEHWGGVVLGKLVALKGKPLVSGIYLKYAEVNEDGKLKVLLCLRNLTPDAYCISDFAWALRELANQLET